MKRLIMLCAAMLVLMIPAAASATTMTFVMEYNPLGSNTAAVESAMLKQLNQQVQPWWGSPTAAFTPSGFGFPIWWFSNAANAPAGCGDGCHGNNQIWVHVGPLNSEESILSHELVESVVDPSGNGTEIADPVQGYFYIIGGTNVVGADFVYPSYFNHGGTPCDQMRAVLCIP